MKPTNKELEVLLVLWKQGPSTVRTVHEQVDSDHQVGYTTTLKIMQIMHEKGLLSRIKEGKTHIYSPDVSEEVTQNQLLGKLLNTAFRGSASQMVMQLLGNRKSSTEELDEIRAFLDKLEEK